MVTSGYTEGAYVADPGTDEGSYFSWELLSQDIVANTSLIAWSTGWHFTHYSCRGLRQGYAIIDGLYYYYDFDSGDGVHSYNAGHDHRPYFETAGGTATIAHNPDGTKDLAAQMGMAAFPGGAPNTSNGGDLWSLPTIPRDPGAPTAPVLTEVTQTSVVVSWTPNPADGLPNTSYTIGYGTSPSAPTSTTTSSTSPKTITGLDPATKYYFWVKATNSVGTGPYSASSNATTIAGARIKDGGVWKDAIPYVKDGTWKLAQPWVKVLGEWKETT